MKEKDQKRIDFIKYNNKLREDLVFGDEMKDRILNRTSVNKPTELIPVEETIKFLFLIAQII